MWIIKRVVDGRAQYWRESSSLWVASVYMATKYIDRADCENSLSSGEIVSLNTEQIEAHCEIVNLNDETERTKYVDY